MDNKILEIFIPGPAGRLEAKYFKSKEYLWNCGILIFKTEVFFNEFRKHQDIFFRIPLNFKKKGNFYSIEERDFSKFPNISVDYSILEKSEIIYSVDESQNNLVFDIVNINQFG